MKDFLAALGFLTKIPIPKKLQTDNERLAESIAHFPLVGLFLGLILVFVNMGLSSFLPARTTNLILILSQILLTGALHLDGLADTVDGLSAKTKNKDEILDIMRDSRIGVTGVIAVVISILFRYELLNGIPMQLKGAALILMCSVSRWSQVMVSYFSKYARAGEGLGKAFIGNIGRGDFYLATAITISISLFTWFPKGVLILLLCALISWIFKRYIQRRIDGLTGDTVGAISEINEVLILLMIVWLNQ